MTTILSGGLPRPALQHWAANVTAEYAVDNWDELGDLPPAQRLKRLSKCRFEQSDAARNRGTEVHRLAEWLVLGHEVDVPDEIAGHVDAYVAWLDAWSVAPVHVEYVVVSYRHGYAGTADLVADIAGERWLLDIKTSAGVYPETALQLAAYRYADARVTVTEDGHADAPTPEVDRTGVVHVRDDGAELVPVTAGPLQFRQFLYCQQVAGFLDAGQSLIGEPLSPPAREVPA